jgi:hypothetical protein
MKNPTNVLLQDLNYSNAIANNPYDMNVYHDRGIDSLDVNKVGTFQESEFNVPPLNALWTEIEAGIVSTTSDYAKDHNYSIVQGDTNLNSGFTTMTVAEANQLYKAPVVGSAKQGKRHNSIEK